MRRFSLRSVDVESRDDESRDDESRRCCMLEEKWLPVFVELKSPSSSGMPGIGEHCAASSWKCRFASRGVCGPDELGRNTAAGVLSGVAPEEEKDATGSCSGREISSFLIEDTDDAKLLARPAS
jgi:hypothetical protein